MTLVFPCKQYFFCHKNWWAFLLVRNATKAQLTVRIFDQKSRCERITNLIFCANGCNKVRKKKDKKLRELQVPNMLNSGKKFYHSEQYPLKFFSENYTFDAKSDLLSQNTHFFRIYLFFCTICPLYNKVNVLSVAEITYFIDKGFCSKYVYYK